MASEGSSLRGGSKLSPLHVPVSPDSRWGVPGRLSSPVDPQTGSGFFIYPHLEGGAVPCDEEAETETTCLGEDQSSPGHQGAQALPRPRRVTGDEIRRAPHFFPG